MNHLHKNLTIIPLAGNPQKEVISQRTRDNTTSTCILYFTFELKIEDQHFPEIHKHNPRSQILKFCFKAQSRILNLRH